MKKKSSHPDADDLREASIIFSYHGDNRYCINIYKKSDIIEKNLRKQHGRDYQFK